MSEFEEDALGDGNETEEYVTDKKWQSEQSTRMATWSEWANQQRKLAKKLGLTHLDDYLGKLCQVCGKPAKKGSHLALCEAHKGAWVLERNRQAQQRWRNRQKTKENAESKS